MASWYGVCATNKDTRNADLIKKPAAFEPSDDWLLYVYTCDLPRLSLSTAVGSGEYELSDANVGFQVDESLPCFHGNAVAGCEGNDEDGVFQRGSVQWSVAYARLQASVK